MHVSVCCPTVVWAVGEHDSYGLRGTICLAKAELPPISLSVSLNFFFIPSFNYLAIHSTPTYAASISSILDLLQIMLKWMCSSNRFNRTEHLTRVHLVYAWQNTSFSVFLLHHSPDAWTSVTYCSSSCPWWMTSKVRLFMVSALSAWCCSLCSASVRSSVSKSLICWDSSSFHDSRSEMIWEDGRKESGQEEEVTYR